MLMGPLSFFFTSIFLFFLSMTIYLDYRKTRNKSELYFFLAYFLYGITTALCIFTQTPDINQYNIDKGAQTFLFTELAVTTTFFGNVAFILFVSCIIYSKIKKRIVIPLITIILIGLLLNLLAPKLEVIYVGDFNENRIPLEFGIPVFICQLVTIFTLAILFLNASRKLKGDRKLKAYLNAIAFSVLSVSSAMEISDIFAPIVMYYRIITVVGVILLFITYKYKYKSTHEPTRG